MFGWFKKKETVETDIQRHIREACESMHDLTESFASEVESQKQLCLKMKEQVAQLKKLNDKVRA